MNKNEYKRYKRIGAEIAQLHQDMDDTLSEIRELYIARDTKHLKGVRIRLENIIRETYLRETIREELLLPQYVKMEDGMKPLLAWWDEINEMDINLQDIEEHIAMFLTDNYNHDVCEFNYFVKGDDIYITNIHWNEKQILPHDIKLILKGELREIDNGFVHISRDMNLTTFEPNKGFVLIKHKLSGYVGRYTYKDAITCLMHDYYL